MLNILEHIFVLKIITKIFFYKYAKWFKLSMGEHLAYFAEPVQY